MEDELPPPREDVGDEAIPDDAEIGHVAVGKTGADADRTPVRHGGEEDTLHQVAPPEPVVDPVVEPGSDPRTEPVVSEPVVSEPVVSEPVPGPTTEPGAEPGSEPGRVEALDEQVGKPAVPRTNAADIEPAPRQLMPGDPGPSPSRALAHGRLRHAMHPRATRAQLLAGALCALLGFALVVQARQTQTQGLDSLRQADLVRLLDNVTNAESRAEQDVRDEQAIRDRLLSGTDSSAAAQEAARRRLDTLGLLAGTVPAAGPGIQLEITDPRGQVDAATLLDTLEELRDGGAEVIQIGSVRVVAATAFTDEADGVRVDGRLLTPPYTIKVIGEPQTLARLLQIPGGVLDVLQSKGAQGTVTQPTTVTIDALRSPTRPQYARPAPGATP